MALTNTQRTQVQAVYTAIKNTLNARYTRGYETEGFDVTTDASGNITALNVHISNRQPDDEDGEHIYSRKDVNVW